VRDGNGRWSHGVSGNPGGRPRALRDLQLAARQYTREALDTLVLVMRNGRPTEALAAALALLDRGWGKPRQSVEVSGAEGHPLQIEDVRAANLAIIEGVANRIAGATAAGSASGDPRGVRLAEPPAHIPLDV
jgi:hypothetical protein